MVGGEDRLNRLSALALSEVGEDPCGLMNEVSSAAAPYAARLGFILSRRK